MTRQKSRFWTFIFSLCPGCGEMFMGFMKRGLSLLVPFVFSTVLENMLNVSAFGGLAVIIWVYAFFDSLNLMSLDPERFSGVTDGWLWNVPSGSSAGSGNNYRWLGIALIAVGSYAVLQVLFNYFNQYLGAMYDTIWRLLSVAPKLLIGALIIYFGVKLISGSKNGKDDGNAQQ